MANNQTLPKSFEIIDEHLLISNDITKSIYEKYSDFGSFIVEISQDIEKSIEKINCHPRLKTPLNKQETKTINRLKMIAHSRQQYFEKHFTYHQQNNDIEKKYLQLEKETNNLATIPPINIEKKLQEIDKKRQKLLLEKNKLKKIKQQDKRQIAIKELFSARKRQLTY
ncbi:MAG: hypothetical protein IKW58_00905 [Alphaproteobacteria bacterium]|nr:hypothetical protein [Alphaproteobacteria bacterium]